MTAFNQSLSGSITSTGTLTTLRWYLGVFKFLSVGLVRAVFRASQIITQNRNLT